MTLDEGATHEIESRWPPYRQRNIGIFFDYYGIEYAQDMMAGIQLVRDIHNELKNRGETVWSIDADTTNMLDQLAANNNV